MEWECQPEDISEYVGFVYKIVNKTNDRFYIGQKKYWFKKKLKPLKGITRCRHEVVESDWKTYYGSCVDLQNDVKKYGQENFRRVILKNCKSKAWMNYFETETQFFNRVLTNPKAYNGIINCRIGKNQLNMDKI